MPPPQAISCEICGKKFFKNSYAIHLKQCAKKREESTSQCEYCGHSVSHDEFDNHVSECKKAHKGKKAKKLGKQSAVSDSVRKKIEKADRGESIVPEDGGQLGGEFDPFRRLDEIVQNEDVVKEETEDTRVECEICHRKFNSDRIAKHQLVCQKAKEKEKKNRRKPFTSEDWRVKGTDFENFKDNRTDVKELKRKAKELVKGQQTVRASNANTSGVNDVTPSHGGTGTTDESVMKDRSTVDSGADRVSSSTAEEAQNTCDSSIAHENTSVTVSHCENAVVVSGSEVTCESTTTTEENTNTAEVNNTAPVSAVTSSENAVLTSTSAQEQPLQPTEGQSSNVVSSLPTTETENHLNASMSSTGSTNKSKLRVGDRVKTSNGHEGILRFKGRVWGLWKGMWYGIELEEACGKNNGSCQDVKYFDCAPGHGVFVRPHTVVPVRKWDDDVEEIKQKEKEEKQRLYEEQLRIREKLAAKQSVQKEQGKVRKKASEKPPVTNSSNEKSSNDKKSTVPKLNTESGSDAPPAGSAIEAVRKLSARSSGRNNNASSSTGDKSKQTEPQQNNKRSGGTTHTGSDTTSATAKVSGSSQKSSPRHLTKSSNTNSTTQAGISAKQPNAQSSVAKNKAATGTRTVQDSGRANASRGKPSIPSSKPLSETTANKRQSTGPDSAKAKQQETPDDAESIRRKRAEFFEKKFKQKDAANS